MTGNPNLRRKFADDKTSFAVWLILTVFVLCNLVSAQVTQPFDGRFASFQSGNLARATVPQSPEDIFGQPVDYNYTYVRTSPMGDVPAHTAPLYRESYQAPFRFDRPAPRTLERNIELRGRRSQTPLLDTQPRFYVSVSIEDFYAHLPYLVRLRRRGNVRRLTISMERGRLGFMLLSREVIPVRHRVLARSGGMDFVEIVPVDALSPGEYAFVSPYYTHLPTFTITTREEQSRRP